MAFLEISDLPIEAFESKAIIPLKFMMQVGSRFGFSFMRRLSTFSVFEPRLGEFGIPISLPPFAHLFGGQSLFRGTFLEMSDDP